MRDPAGAAELSHADGPESGVVVGRRRALAVLGHRHPDEAAGLRTLERRGIDPGVLQRLPRHPHRDPLLRVHHHRLVIGQAEEGRVE